MTTAVNPDGIEKIVLNVKKGTLEVTATFALRKGSLPITISAASDNRRIMEAQGPLYRHFLAVPAVNTLTFSSDGKTVVIDFRHDATVDDMEAAKKKILELARR